MTSLFIYLLLYYVLIGIARLINNQVILFVSLLIYLMGLLLIIYKKHILSKYKHNNMFYILLIIPLINIVLCIRNGINVSSDIVFLLIISSIVEELLFRYLLINWLNKKYSFKTSMVLSSICFSPIHLLNISNIQDINYMIVQVFYAFSIGLCLAELLILSKSIAPPIIVHMLINITSIYVYNIKCLLTYIIISIIYLFIGVFYLRKKKYEIIH